jgi:hypothetical protein
VLLLQWFLREEFWQMSVNLHLIALAQGEQVVVIHMTVHIVMVILALLENAVFPGQPAVVGAPPAPDANMIPVDAPSELAKGMETVMVTEIYPAQFKDIKLSCPVTKILNRQLHNL